ncbi:MAG TPA: hypothetical protein VFX20_17630 [Steroidobacteraceae bacterium]|nr:hypothetical protein [Steroidobacteraceae bacterium]
MNLVFDLDGSLADPELGITRCMMLPPWPISIAHSKIHQIERVQEPADKSQGYCQSTPGNQQPKTLPGTRNVEG